MNFYGQPMLMSEAGLRDILKIDISAISTTANHRANAYLSQSGGTAIIEIGGPIFKNENIFTMAFGWTACETISAAFSKTLNDPDIREIVLNINSPGGQVAGVNELANQIFNARGRKPITAFVDGVAASAAYWIATAADKIVLDPTAEVGSIGCVYSIPAPDGSIEIVSTNAPFKRPDMSTSAGRAEIQQRADAVADVFVNAVARNRGVSKAKVLTDFGMGGMFVGSQSVSAGMADSTGSFDRVVSGGAGDYSHSMALSQDVESNPLIADAMEKAGLAAPASVETESNPLIADALCRAREDNQADNPLIANALIRSRSV